jgi:hypothetical protein
MGADMSDQFSEGDIAKIVGHPVMMALGAALAWLTAGRSPAVGSALAALLSIVGGIAFLAFSLMYRRFLGILGAGGDPLGSPECESYVKLRDRLAKGGLAAHLYARRLTGFLDRADSFFGDAGMANRSLFPHAFGLRTQEPLWTPRAFDRCLFLALVYPIATIFIIWAVSGHAGPAEMALGLKQNVPGWSRGFIAAAAAFEGFAIWSLFRAKGGTSFIWVYTATAFGIDETAGVDAVVALAAVAGAVTLTIAFGSIGAGAVAFGVAVVGAVARSGRIAGAITVAAAIPVAFGLAFGLGGAGPSTVASVVGAAAAVSIGILLLAAFAINRQAQGQFLLFFIPAMIAACFAAVGLLLPLRSWPYAGPLLLFQGLLTLINAPFNWASIGLTRALLRRGLELGGWWPYFLGVVNAILATAIVAALVLTMVIAVQAFDALVVHGGRAPILPLGPLFDGISKNPAAPEYWWIYALLLATMIPSLISLMIGGASLISGMPGLPSLLLQFMPEGKAVAAFDRTWLAITLTLQSFSGAILGIAAEAFLAVGLAVYVMPSAGLNLLDQARAVTAFDLPARVFQLFIGAR